MGKSEFDTHMNLESSDANLLKYPINFLFSNTIIIYLTKGVIKIIFYIQTSQL